MKSFAVGNLVLAFMFLVVAVSGIFGGQYLEFIAWASLMVGALALGDRDKNLRDLPRWRRTLGLATVVLGAGLVIYGVALTLFY